MVGGVDHVFKANGTILKILESGTAEIDVFPFWEDRAFCEAELPAEDTPVTLPDWLEVVREVSADKRYTNLALAREIPMEEI